MAEYGLGAEPYQTFPGFEQTAFTLVDPTTATMSPDGQNILANGLTGTYSLFAEGINEVMTRTTSIAGAPVNDYLVGRMAITPHDIRLECSMYAEEGSFFVIPGPWFNPNPNDRRDFYNTNSDIYAGLASVAEKNAMRLQTYGAGPNMPFYGEPLDVRISIIGAISENMPPPASVQAQWLQKWGWIPRDEAATGLLIPSSHVPVGWSIDPTKGGSFAIVPNLTLSYDQVLATGRSNGFIANNDNSPTSPSPIIRFDGYGHALPPLPRLPVSPTLAYFGEVH